jgi:hypothetical protein
MRESPLQTSRRGCHEARDKKCNHPLSQKTVANAHTSFDISRFEATQRAERHEAFQPRAAPWEKLRPFFRRPGGATLRTSKLHLISNASAVPARYQGGPAQILAQPRALTWLLYRRAYSAPASSPTTVMGIIE